MRSRPARLLAIVLAVAAFSFGTTRVAPASAAPHSPAHASLRARPAAYLGAYETGSPGSYGQIMDFAKAAGSRPNLAGYYGGWWEPFKTGFAKAAAKHGAATLLQLDPTNVPVAEIAAGGYDAFLRSFAGSVRDFGHPVVIGFGHEMNAGWYSWGYGHVRPAIFVAAWRHIVNIFRSQGADNVTWLWTIQADIPGAGPIRDWWPGPRYVTWVGIDGYYFRPSDTFAGIFGRTIQQVRSFTSRPILLAETAVGPRAGQFAKIQDLFRGMAAYQTLGLVWFDISQHDGIYHQDWRIEDHRRARLAFRLGIRMDLGRRLAAS